MITEHLLNPAEVKSAANPFPGLRSFEYHENDLFFGREGQSEEMVLKLDKTHFLAVVGTSGSGKSSLVRAGLWPALRGDLMESAGSAWRIVVMRPGNSPIASLAIALNYPVDLKSKDTEQVCIPTVRTVQTEVTLRRGSPGLIEAVRQAQLEPDESILIVVDQFEELFRFTRISEDEAYANDAAAFVKLLLDAKQQPNIYIVLTMRSDYLGECARFWDLPEAINEGQYLIPRMTPTQRREAITGPIGVRGASISPRLVDQLLMDMGDSPQQLPILQHALMRIWDNWRAKGDENAPLDIFHYQECGGLAETLSRHANEAYDELPDDRSRWIAEKLFKCLTEKGADVANVKETRRPTELGEICRIADASEAEVIAIINIFRREGRCFLMPSEKMPLTGDTVIDISHESLISYWDKLRTWINDEAYSARFYRQLAERAYSDRNVEPLGDYRLQQAVDWRDHTRPNVAWCSRHHVSVYDPPESSPKAKSARDEEIFRCVIALIDTSQETHDRKEEARKQKRQKKLQQAKRFIAILTGVSAIILVLALTAWYQWYVAQEQTRVARNMRNRAEGQTKMVNLLNYRAIMNRAQKEYVDEHFGAANQFLENLFPKKGEEDLRGFDWNYLWRMLHNERATLRGHSGKVCVAISPDGKTIATGSEDHQIRLWDADTQGPKRAWKGHENVITSVAFSPDGKTLATGSADGTVILWDPSTGTLNKGPYLFPNPDKSNPEDKNKPPAVTSIAFARNGLMAIGLDDGRVETVLGDVKGHTSIKHVKSVWSVAFSPDGTNLVSGSADGTVQLWNVSTGQARKLPMSLNSESIYSVAFSPDGKTIAAGTKEGLRLWETKSGSDAPFTLPTVLSRTYNSPSEPTFTLPTVLFKILDSPSDYYYYNDGFYKVPAILSLTFRDNDTLITGNADASLRLWNRKNLTEELVLKGHFTGVSSVAFSPDGKTVVTGSADATAKLWDISQKSQTIWPNKQDPEVFPIAFFPKAEDKRLVGRRADGSIVLWDTDSRRELQLLTGSAANIRSVTVATDRTIASWSEDNENKIVTLWRPTTDGTYESALKKITPIPIQGEVTSVAFSPDGKMLATGSADGTVKLWDTSTGAGSTPLSPSHKGKVWAVAFSSDGKMLATGGADHNINLWNTSTGKNLKPLHGHLNEVVSVAFSPDNKLLASGSSDNTAILWDVDAGKELTTITGHNSAVTFVAFFPDGTRLATGSNDTSVKLWDTDINQPGWKRWQELASSFSYKGNEVQSLAFSPDRMMLAIGRKKGFELWLAATPEEVETQRIESRK